MLPILFIFLLLCCCVSADITPDAAVLKSFTAGKVDQRKALETIDLLVKIASDDLIKANLPPFEYFDPNNIFQQAVTLDPKNLLGYLEMQQDMATVLYQKNCYPTVFSDAISPSNDTQMQLALDWSLERSDPPWDTDIYEIALEILFFIWYAQETAMEMGDVVINFPPEGGCGQPKEEIPKGESNPNLDHDLEESYPPPLYDPSLGDGDGSGSNPNPGGTDSENNPNPDESKEETNPNPGNTNPGTNPNPPPPPPVFDPGQKPPPAPAPQPEPKPSPNPVPNPDPTRLEKVVTQLPSPEPTRVEKVDSELPDAPKDTQAKDTDKPTVDSAPTNAPSLAPTAKTDTNAKTAKTDQSDAKTAKTAKTDQSDAKPTATATDTSAKATPTTPAELAKAASVEVLNEAVNKATDALNKLGELLPGLSGDIKDISKQVEALKDMLSKLKSRDLHKRDADVSAETTRVISNLQALIDKINGTGVLSSEVEEAVNNLKSVIGDLQKWVKADMELKSQTTASVSSTMSATVNATMPETTASASASATDSKDFDHSGKEGGNGHVELHWDHECGCMKHGADSGSSGTASSDTASSGGTRSSSNSGSSGSSNSGTSGSSSGSSESSGSSNSGASGSSDRASSGSSSSGNSGGSGSVSSNGNSGSSSNSESSGKGGSAGSSDTKGSGSRDSSSGSRDNTHLLSIAQANGASSLAIGGLKAVVLFGLVLV